MTDTRQARGGGDPDEIQRAQRGDRRAFLHLYERHAPMAWRLALVAGRDRAAAEAAVVAAFGRVLGRADRHDRHRFAPVGAQLLRSAREGAIEQSGRLAQPSGLESIVDVSHEDTVRAFDHLPECWRTALWLDQVEHTAPSTTALVLDASEQSAQGLATRALGGFREQLTQQKVHPFLRPDCRQATLRLSAYAAHALPSRDTIRVRRHLDRCEDCRARLDELDDVTTHLRGALPALPIALESLAMGAWIARAHDGAGPIGLRLPGGALAPAWVERSLAGATAAMVSLGISAAVLLNARDGGSPVPTESAIARTDGEQALGADTPIDTGTTDGSATVVIDSTDASSGASGSDGTPAGGPSAGTDPALAPSSAPTPRGGGTAPTSPTSPTGPSPTPTPTPTPTPPPTGEPPDSSPDPTSDAVDQVVDVVDDVIAPPPVCTGIALLDDVVCD